MFTFIKLQQVVYEFAPDSLSVGVMHVLHYVSNNLVSTSFWFCGHRTDRRTDGWGAILYHPDASAGYTPVCLELHNHGTYHFLRCQPRQQHTKCVILAIS